MIFAASFASSLLGSQALADGLGAWDWIALGLLFVIGALAVLMLWPYYNLTFRFDPEVLLARYVDVPQPPPMATGRIDESNHRHHPTERQRPPPTA